MIIPNKTRHVFPRKFKKCKTSGCNNLTTLTLCERCLKRGQKKARGKFP